MATYRVVSRLEHFVEADSVEDAEDIVFGDLKLAMADVVSVDAIGIEDKTEIVDG